MENNEEKKDDEVGYKKPPKAHQFKPNQSGNYNGRPPRPKTTKDALVQVLAEKIVVNSNGKKIKMTRLEALVTKLVQDALNGDKQARSLIMKDYSHNIQLPYTEEDNKEHEETSKTKKYLKEKNLSSMDEDKVHMEAIRLARNVANEIFRERK